MTLDKSILTEFLLDSILSENKNNKSIGLGMTLQSYNYSETWTMWSIDIMNIPGWRNPKSARCTLRGLAENENDIERSAHVRARWNCLKTYLILFNGVKESRREILRIMFGRTEDPKKRIERWADSTLGQIVVRDLFGEGSGFSTEDYKAMILNVHSYLFKTSKKFESYSDEVQSFL